ncbi:hypothetical protein K443DRAFT_113033, partial [Laccaria amethystina LaAM-08-1]
HPGPYNVIDIDKEYSSVLPNSPSFCPTYHTSEVMPYIKLDTMLLASHNFDELDPIITETSDKEFYIEHILNA